MKKVLFTSHLANFVKFNKPFMQWFQGQGWEVHYASLDEEELPFCSQHFKVDFNRSPYSLDNYKAYKQLKKIIDREKYNIIHCHTPMGGVVTRLAAREARKNGTKVIYTAHGFHFYKGAPIQNWLFYYPVEKLLAQYTDSLIVINEEDYSCAQRKKIQAAKIHRIHGVGVDLEKFKSRLSTQREELRQKHKIPADAFALLTVAEFTSNKNQMQTICDTAQIKDEFPQLYLLFAGAGAQLEACKHKARELGLEDRSKFLGYCRSMEEIYSLADVLMSMSQREGLPINILEAMASGLPVLCTDVRGSRELVVNEQGGFVFIPGDSEGFVRGLKRLIDFPDKARDMGAYNTVAVAPYGIENAVKNMADIYKPYMEESTISVGV